MDAASPPPTAPLPGSLAQQIRTARTQRGQSPADLAGPEFSPAYIAALERGAVPPSPPALAYLAARLDLPLPALAALPCPLTIAVDLPALEEDLRYQANCALRLIRDGQPNAGLELIAGAEAYAGPYLAALPAAWRYRLPFLRGRAYYQQAAFAQAEAALTAALALAESDPDALVQTANLLGAVLAQREHHEQALAQHLGCLHLLQTAPIADLNLRFSVYRNLATDYLALQDLPHAIAIYQQALALLADLDDPERRAAILWGLLLACRESGDTAQAKLYGLQALRIYEERDRPAEAAAVCLNLAEIFLDEARPDEAARLLKQAKWWLRDTPDAGPRSYLYGDWAMLAVQAGDLGHAAAYAAQSLELAATHRSQPASGAPAASAYPTRTYAEALQVTALVAEARGEASAAAALCAQALEVIGQTGFDEAAQTMRRRYAQLLAARGAVAEAVAYYQVLAGFRPRSRQG
jgi:transcriptional regulator with XRE-family HTH domain